ncbi:MAG TPA: guanylate kinase [Chlamydiales bacterium]|nr:guanylate kinase [Chlamydiales bacterium]
MRKKGIIFVVSAPAGTGKTTLVRMLQDEFPHIIESVSYTTRKPRAQEIPGKDYYFITHQEFVDKIANGEFLEYAKVFGNYYGTSRKFFEDEQKIGNHIVFVIDTQGAKLLKDKIDAVFIFIRPPSMEVLKERLLARKSESSEAISERLLWAEKEMKCIDAYDYEIVNDRLDHAYDVLRSIVIAETHRL